MRRMMSMAFVGATLVLWAGTASGRELYEPSQEPVLGVGYKLGNGIGFAGGDLIIAPIAHFCVDLQGSYLSGADGAAGFALAPQLQVALNAGRRSTPYAGVGVQYARLARDGITASAKGMFANVGYEFRWESGLGVQLGLGVQHLGKAEATDGVQKVSIEGGTMLNLEAGIRYMFL